MSTTNTIDEVETYISEVRERLADVPDEDRIDLLDDVAAHVREIADEFGADALHERLGTPEEFTNELRVSAGYGTAGDPDTITSPPSRVHKTRAWIDAHVRTDANRVLWRKLEPGWFVVRGASVGYLLSRSANNGFASVVLVVAGAVVSYRLGERRPAPQRKLVRRARIAGEVLLALVAIGFLSDAGSDRIVYVDSGSAGFVEGDPCLRDGAGRAIGNLYAFDPAGQLIPQFFLTDQAGRPIQNLCPEQFTKNDLPVETEYARDVNGSPVYGVFPRAQTEMRFDPSTQQMTKQPSAPPAVVLPQLSTPTTQAPAP